jgi:polyhydroxyalkanoate synthesis repressor PhaR
METQTESSSKPQSDQIRVVKRYSNRKLYDTRESRYVTLLQIAQMVRAGEHVQVIDNNTKNDLTDITLAQIIYEEQKLHNRALSVETLRNLVLALETETIRMTTKTHVDSDAEKEKLKQELHTLASRVAELEKKLAEKRGE